MSVICAVDNCCKASHCGKHVEAPVCIEPAMFAVIEEALSLGSFLGITNMGH